MLKNPQVRCFSKEGANQAQSVFRFDCNANHSLGSGILCFLFLKAKSLAARPCPKLKSSLLRGIARPNALESPLKTNGFTGEGE